LRKVDNSNAFEAIKLDADSIHLSLLLPKSRRALYRRMSQGGNRRHPTQLRARFVLCRK